MGVEALHRRTGCTVITVTHDADLARRAELTLELRDGRLVEVDHGAPIDHGAPVDGGGGTA